MSLHICAPCYYPDKSKAELLWRSCEKQGATLHLFGVGKQWNSNVDAKLRGFAEYLKAVKTDYTMLLDGDDTLLLQPPEKIEELADTYWLDRVVLAGNKELWPTGLAEDMFPLVGVTYRYPNAGCILGPTDLLLERVTYILDNLGTVKVDSDQYYWVQEYLRGRVVIDNFCRLCQNMSGGGRDDVVLSDGSMYNRALDSYPCVAHWGGRFPGRERWWRKLK